MYLFHGEEDYLRDYYLETVRKKLLPPGTETFNLHVFQGKDLDLQTLSDCVDALPMLNDRTVLVVYDYDLFKNEERRSRLEGLFQDLPDYVCLIFVYDLLPFKANGNTRLGKLIKKVGVTVEFQPQQQSDLNAWIRRHFKALGKEIDNSTAEYLTFLCGGLMTGLGGEIEKIGSYAPGEKITKADIDAVATPVLDARVFAMSDAIGAGRFDQAMAVLSDLYQMNEAPIKILAVLGTQLRQMWSARLALGQKKGQGYLSGLWKLRTSWQAGSCWTLPAALTWGGAGMRWPWRRRPTWPEIQRRGRRGVAGGPAVKAGLLLRRRGDAENQRGHCGGGALR